MNLLLVGGGHAILPALQRARTWTAHGVRVTLLDGHRYLYYSGMVPEYLGGVYERDAVRIDLKRLCDVAGASFVAEEAAQLDPEQRRVITTTGRTLSYDVAALDVGARNPGMAPNAIHTKPLHHIEALVSAVRAHLDAPWDALQLLIAGGGAAGVEVALNITGRFAAQGTSEALTITIVEASDRLMPDFPEALSAYVAQRLEAHGVQLRLSSRVTSVDDRTVVLDEREALAADHVLWATGSTGPAFFDEAGLVTDAQGFARVTPTLQCMHYPHLFAAGDCATVAGHEALRKIGVNAVKQGSVLCTNLDRALQSLRAYNSPNDGQLDRFAPYPVAPLILSTGTSEAIWTAGALWFHGRPFLRLKHWLDRRWIRRYNPYWASRSPMEFVAADAALP